MICQYEPAAWAVLRAQRLAIEVLMHTRNVGLREYLLPDLLAKIISISALIIFQLCFELCQLFLSRFVVDFRTFITQFTFIINLRDS